MVGAARKFYHFWKRGVKTKSYQKQHAFITSIDLVMVKKQSCLLHGVYFIPMIESQINLSFKHIPFSTLKLLFQQELNSGNDIQYQSHHRNVSLQIIIHISYKQCLICQLPLQLLQKVELYDSLNDCYRRPVNSRVRSSFAKLDLALTLQT